MSAGPNNLLGRFLKWRARHLPQRQFVLILSVVVGFLTGLVAAFLKNSTHFIQELVTSDYLTDYYNPFYFAFPIIGILITVFIRRMMKGKVGEGVPTTLFAISRKSGFLPAYQMFSYMITSIFTVGFGGSVGLEGPSVGTGSAIGSNLGRIMHINYKSRILLISCASAGAIASIFNAPIAAIIFTIEIFSLDLTFGSLIPLLLASAAGAVTSIFIQGGDYLFHYKYIAPFTVGEIPFYVLLGVMTAFVSVYFNRLYFYVDNFFGRFNRPAMKILVGGGLLGLLIFLIPPLYGEGYETINHLLNGNLDKVVERSFLYEYLTSDYLVLALLIGLVLFKGFATTFTLGAGGVGGVFAPSLFIGASSGFVFARFINELGWVTLSSSNYALVGMAGLMAGVLHAPLTAIFMIAEITGGYELFIPLMLVSAISFLVTRNLMPHSVYTMQLARKGDILTHNKDQVILTLLTIDKVLEKDFKKVKPDMTLGELVKVVSTSNRNLFPVIDEEGKLTGVLTLDDFRNIMFDQSLYETTYVSGLMNPPPATIEKNETMSSVMQKFQLSGAWNLPVVDRGRYLGFVSKSKMFSVYRRKLLEFSE
ncbi:MAG: chloride channel protein [Owenweeksia sp.]